MAVSPWTDSAKMLVSALYGDPAARAEMAKNESDLSLNLAKTNESEVNARAKSLEMDKLQRQLTAQQDYGNVFTQALAPVQEPALNAPLNPMAEGPAQRPEFMRAPSQLEMNERLPDLLSTSLQAGANPQDIGTILQAFQGQLANVGEVDPLAIQRNTAFGAGKPFNKEQIEAQVFGTLPFDQQQDVARAVPTDKVFGGALVADPNGRLAQIYQEEKLPADVRTARIAQTDPVVGDYVNAQNMAKRPFETTSEKLQAESFSKYQDDLLKTVGNNQQMALKFNEAKAALARGVETGAAQPTMLTLKKLAKDAGLIQAKDYASIADQEAMGAIGNLSAMILRNPDSGGGLPGATSERDLQFLKDSTIGLSQTPQGLKLLLDMYDRKMQFDMDLLNYSETIKESNGGRAPSNYRSMLANYANKHQLISPEEKEQINALTGGVQPAAASPAGAPVTPQAAPTRRTLRNPSTGETVQVDVYPDGRKVRVQ